MNYLLCKFLQNRMPEYRFRHYLPLQKILLIFRIYLINLDIIATMFQHDSIYSVDLD